MKSQTVAAAPCQADDDEDVVHAWRVRQLIRLGLAAPAAEAVADTVDWHEVEKLVLRGCPPALAVTIVD